MVAYGYVRDVDSGVDVWGLMPYFRGASERSSPDFTPRDPVKTKKGWSGDYRPDENGNVSTEYGLSVFNNQEKVKSKGFIPHEIDPNSLPETLDIIQRGNDMDHYEIVPKKPMHPNEYKKELSRIKCKQ